MCQHVAFHKFLQHMKLSFYLCTALGVLMCLVPPSLFAEGSTKQEIAKANTADIEWESLKKLGASSSVKNADTRSSEQRKAEEIAELVRQADSFKDFRSRYPDHKEAPTARQKEAITLIQAAMKGESSQAARRDALLEVVRKDQDLHPTRRFEAVAWNKQLIIEKKQPKSRASFLAEQEVACRELIKEFPGVADGYESLLAVARDSDVAKAKVLLDELDQSSAPPWVKERVALQRIRFGLLNRTITSVLADVGESALLNLGKGSPMVIYSWSQNAANSQKIVRALAAKNKAVIFLGVCLDIDSAGVRKVATSANLPGIQRYSTSGVSGRLATAFGFSRPGEIIIVDASSVITDIHGANDSFAKLAQVKR